MEAESESNDPSLNWQSAIVKQHTNRARTETHPIRIYITNSFWSTSISPIVSFIKCDFGKIHFRNGLYLKSVKNNVHIFKLMSEETMAKMKLIELIQD